MTEQEAKYAQIQDLFNPTGEKFEPEPELDGPDAA